MAKQAKFFKNSGDGRNICLIILTLPVFFAPGAFCDSQTLYTYKQQFSGVDLAEKAQVLEDAAFDKALGEYAGQLYEYALQFALDNSELLKNDPDMIKIAGIAVDGLGNTGYSESVTSLWELFLEYPDSAVGAETLITLGKLGKGNRYIIDNINNYLLEKTLLYTSGESVNYAMISTCITAILELGDSSSYPALFAVMCAGYPEIITFEAYGAFELIPGNFIQFLLDVIEKNPPAEKFTALKAGINSERLNLPERGQLAEFALEQGLMSYNDARNADLSDMRYAAVSALIPLRWTRAGALAVRHYYLVQADFQRDAVSKEHFIEAITLMGAVGDSEAALALGLQLGLINARTERTGEFDAEITLAIVQALGLIGDNAAFDHLLYIGNLPYPEYIKAAAKEAIDRLKW